MTLDPLRRGKSGAQGDSGQDFHASVSSVQHIANEDGSETSAIHETSLDDLLRSRSVRAAGADYQRFIPSTVLDDLITPGNVRRELDRVGAERLSSEALQVVCDWRKKGTLRKTFAILCLIQKASEIKAFIDEDLADKCLPYQFSTTSDEVLRNVASEPTQPVRLFRTARWRPVEREAFNAYQWQLLAPYFILGGESHYHLASEQILPFVHPHDVDEVNGMEGGFSRVHRIQIHPAYHAIFDKMAGSWNHFAVKSLNKETGRNEHREDDFKREVEALRRLNGQSHIISLLATYEHKDQMAMIFPWADANLRDFWKSNPVPRSLISKETIAWVSDQILGLAKALQLIHEGGVGTGKETGRRYGRHGDLKPENILWFKSEGESHLNGILKIADFGAAEFIDSASGIKVKDVRTITETYKAPEIDTHDYVHQQYDVWSFGCLLLEFAVWFLQGWRGITEFSDARVAESRELIPSDSYYSLHVNPKDQKLSVLIKPSVSRTIQKLKSDPLSGDYILGLLTIIEKRLLLLRPEERASISAIVEDLAALHPHVLEGIKPGPARIGPSDAENYRSAPSYELASTDESSSESEYSIDNISLDELNFEVVETINATLQEASNWRYDDSKIIHHLYSVKTHFSHWINSLEWILMCQDSSLDESDTRAAVKNLFGTLESQKIFLSGIIRSHLRGISDALDQMRRLHSNASIGSTYSIVLHTLQQDLSSAVECLGQQLIPVRAFVESSIHPKAQSNLASEVQSMANVLRDLEPVDIKVDNAQGTQGMQYAEDIRLILLSAEVKSADHGIAFLPLSILRETLSELRVKRELVYHGGASTKDLSEEDFTALTALIRSQYLKVFAILVLMDQVEDISSFVRDNLRDSDLPIKLDLKSGQLLRGEDQTVSLLKGWKQFQRDQFLYHQRRVDVPYLAFDETTDAVKHVDFTDETTLPFLEFGNIHHGGLAYLRRVKIHPACHGFDGKVRNIRTYDNFALKCLLLNRKSDPGADTMFRKEVEISRSLSRTHDHIVSLLMTWTYRDNYYLLFPLADGNLSDFWSARNLRIPEPGDFDNHSTARWMSEQFTGLISAVYTIHHPQGLSSTRFGRHGDLKPENILWYKSGNSNGGTLVISDFGSSTTNTRFSRSNIPLDKISMTPTYRPPEYDIEDRGASRADDIWSLGCVLLEFVCWALGGGEMVMNFELDRISPYSNGIASDIFFEANVMPNGRHLVRVKRQVSAYIAQLHQHKHCTRFHHDILDIIENDMLVVVSPERQRITSNELVKKYSEVHFMVKSSDGYCTTSCPETRAVQTEPFLEAKLRLLPFNQGHRWLSVGIPLAEPTAAKTDIQIIKHKSVSGVVDHEDKQSNQTSLRPADALHSKAGADSIQNLTADSRGSYTLPLSRAWKRDRDRHQIQLQHATYHPQRILKRISRSYNHRSHDLGRRIQHI